LRGRLYQSIDRDFKSYDFFERPCYNAVTQNPDRPARSSIMDP
jgi:hypothetical protein